MGYKEYISENINIDYANYIAENLDKNIAYSEYILENSKWNTSVMMRRESRKNKIKVIFE